MVPLAFIGDEDKTIQEKLINLLKTATGVKEFKGVSNPFSDHKIIYVVIDDFIISVPNIIEKKWKDIDVRCIKIYLKNIQFWIGDKVVRTYNKEEVCVIEDIKLNLNNDIVYKLNSTNPKGCWELANDLLPAPELDIVGYVCNHCGKVMRSKKPHMCNGNYRCRKLNFSPIVEDQGFIEIPKGLEFNYVEGNKIRLKNIEKD